MTNSFRVGRRRRILVTLGCFLGIAILAGAAWILHMRIDPRNVPEGQPPLEALDDRALGDLKSQFNAGASRTRILALLSPT